MAESNPIAANYVRHALTNVLHCLLYSIGTKIIIVHSRFSNITIPHESWTFLKHHFVLRIMTYLGPEKKVGPSRGDKTHGPDSTSFRSRFFS